MDLYPAIERRCLEKTRPRPLAFALIPPRPFLVIALQSAVDLTDPGGGQGTMPPPYKNRPKKDGRRRWRLISHVSCPHLYHVSGSTTESATLLIPQGA